MRQHRGTAQVRFLPTRSRRPARHRDRPRRGVSRLVRPGFRWCRRLPGAVGVLLRRSSAAHRADAGRVAVAGSRGDPAGSPAAARARRRARRFGGADNPDPAGNALGDVCRPEPGQPRLLPELGAGEHRVGLSSRRRGGQSAAAHLVDVGAGPVLHRVPGADLLVRLPVPPCVRQAHAGRVRRAAERADHRVVRLRDLRPQRRSGDRVLQQLRPRMGAAAGRAGRRAGALRPLADVAAHDGRGGRRWPRSCPAAR